MTAIAPLAPPMPLMIRAAAFARTIIGRMVIVIGATAVLAGLQLPFWWAVGIFLMLTSLLPQRRKGILVLAALCWVFFSPPVDLALLGELAPSRGAEHYIRAWPIAVVLTWCIAFAYLWLIRRFPKSPPARRPVVGLLTILVALLLATRAPITGVPWLIITAVAMAFGSYIWFFAYWLSDNHKPDKANPLLRTYAWRPMWGFTNVPFGKGAAYLEKHEAKDDEQLALSQIKGLKLLTLAVMWTAILIVAKRFLLGPSGSLTEIPYAVEHGRIPTYQMALDAMIDGHPYAWPYRWAAVATYFSLWVMHFTIFGHKIIAIARLAGFNIFRNTYRPILATSIAEFYNQVYYYFKELLVTFFFYPTYLRYFKTRPKLRLFIATLAAAGFGNFLFHFLRDQGSIFRRGLFGALWFYRAYAVYALLLGVAISISQQRVLARKGKHPTGLSRVAAITGCLLFYCMICMIEEPNEHHTLKHYWHYFLSLFHP